MILTTDKFVDFYNLSKNLSTQPLFLMASKMKLIEVFNALVQCCTEERPNWVRGK